MPEVNLNLPGRPAPPPAAAGSTTCGTSGNEVHPLVVLVKFQGEATPTFRQPAFFDNLVFGTGAGTLRTYFAENSRNQMVLTPATSGSDTFNPSFFGWVEAPQPLSYYLNDGDPSTGDASGNDMGMGQCVSSSNCRNAQGLVRDIVQRINQDFPVLNLGDFDCNSDGAVDSVILIHSGTGAEVSGSTAHIYSHQSDISGAAPLSLDGKSVTKYITVPEYWYRSSWGSFPANAQQMTVGVLAHEYGHLLGLPELWDTDGGSKGVGRWSLMGHGLWNGSAQLGGTPAHLDAWSKQKLGFVAPQLVAGFNPVELKQLLSIYQGGQVLRLNLNLLPEGSEYFLIENRQKEGFDASLPGEGLLVWHVDESVVGSWNETHPNDDQYHPMLALKQADGLNQLGSGTSEGDANDPFPGTAGAYTIFSATSNPSSRDYSGADRGVNITGISNLTDGSKRVQAQVDSRTTFVPADTGSIQTAINAIPSSETNNTIVVSPGSYGQRIEIRNKTLTLKGANGSGETFLDGSTPVGGTPDCPYDTSSSEFAKNGVCKPMILLQNSNSVIEGFTIQNNVGGGGMIVLGGAPTVRDNVFQNNYKNSDRVSSEPYYRAEGAGLYVESGASLIENNIFKGNHGNGGHGGGLTLVDDRKRFNSPNNPAYDPNYVDTTASTVRNNIVSQNYESSGMGGMVIFGGFVNVFHNTIADNTGVGLWIYSWSGDTIAVHNNVLFNNTSRDLLLGFPALPNIQRTLIGTASQGSAGYPSDWYTDPAHPLHYLAAGNLYATSNVFAASGSYELSGTSGAVDAGLGSSASALDMRGRARCDHRSVTNTGSGVPNYADLGALESSCPSGSSGFGTCFLAGTGISYADGTVRPIESVKEGDLVLSFDERSKGMSTGKVVKTFKHEAPEHLVINGFLKVTPEHPVWNAGKFVEIGQLKVGDELLTAGGQVLKISSIEKRQAKAEVFNFEVEKLHTYVAGGIVVHNKARPGPGAAAEISAAAR